MDELSDRVARHRAAYEQSHRPAYAKAWAAALELKKDMEARARRLRGIEDKLLEVTATLAATPRTRTVTRTKEVVVRYPEYEYGTGTWVLSALILFVSVMLLANMEWVAGATALSFWVSAALAVTLVGIAGFFIVRAVSQKF